MLSQDDLNKITSKLQLRIAGFDPVGEAYTYVPDYFTIDGEPGDYGDYVYRHVKTGQVVTLSFSREFGIFHLTPGDTRGKHKWS